MDFRRESWMKSLGMNFDGSYKARSLEIRQFYESQKLVIGEYDHPLSQSPKSFWWISLQNSRMLKDIQMDARRVFSDDPFFQSPEILNITEEVLFTWSKQHKEKYNQGMMYILNIIIYVVIHSGSLDHFADCYMLFDRILSCGLLLYFQSSSSFLHQKTERILNNYLKLIDVEFYLYLNKLDVDLTVIIMRWLRCMFVKEFEFDEVLKIWDFIIENKQEFAAMDMVALAMLVWARDFGNEDVVRGESFEVVQGLARVRFRGNGKCILFLAKRFFGYVLMNRFQDRYMVAAKFNRFV